MSSLDETHKERALRARANRLRALLLAAGGTYYSYTYGGEVPHALSFSPPGSEEPFELTAATFVELRRQLRQWLAGGVDVEAMEDRLASLEIAVRALRAENGELSEALFALSQRVGDIERARESEQYWQSHVDSATE